MTLCTLCNTEQECYQICPVCLESVKNSAVLFRALDVMLSLENANIPVYTKRQIEYAVRYIIGEKVDDKTEDEGPSVED